MKQRSPAVIFVATVAVMCMVLMYVSHDENTSAEEDVKLSFRSTASFDFVKALTFFTSTPRGASELLIYLKGVEANLSAEKAKRKAVMTSIRARIARNMVLAKAARDKMQKTLNAKIAANAKRAHDAMVAQMRRVQEQFAESAQKANVRNRQNNKNIDKMNARIEKNRRAAKQALHDAVVAQQRATTAVSQNLQSKITQTNSAISANAVQMRKDAKHARKALAGAINSFNHKLANAHEEAKKGRSKLAEQLASQTKRIRQWASSKILKFAADTAAKFKSVRHKMAKNRERVDHAVASMTHKFSKALDEHKAAHAKHEKMSASALADYRKTASDNLKKAKAGWKASMVHMTSVVKQQESKLLGRINEVSDTEQKNKAIQQRVNRRLNAECKRVTKLGLKRAKLEAKAHTKITADEKASKRKTWGAIQAQRRSFTTQIGKMRKSLKKDRAAAASKLKAASAKLYSTLRSNELAQKKTNNKIAAATAAVSADAAANLKAAQAGFNKAMNKMAGKMAADDRKGAAQWAKLTGVVAKNAVKDREGRNALLAMQRSQRADLQNALHQYVESGKRRAAANNKRIMAADAATRAKVSMTLSSAITTMRRQGQAAIDKYRLQDKAAIAAIRNALVADLTQAKKEMAAETKKAMAAAKDKILAARRAMLRGYRLKKLSRDSYKKRLSSVQQSALKAIKDAQSAEASAQMALSLSTKKKIKAANKSITASADAMMKSIQKASATLKGNAASLNSARIKSKKSLGRSISKSNRRSKKLEGKASRSFASKMAKMKADTAKKFVAFYGKMAANRKKQDQALAGTIKVFNTKLAKAAALTDARFAKTVKNLDAARAAARRELAAAKADAKTRLIRTKVFIKKTESFVRGKIAAVSKMARSNRQQQAAVNRASQGEISRIIKLTNSRASSAARARGAIRKVMDANKALAARLVLAQMKATNKGLDAASRKWAAASIEARRNLTKKTGQLQRKIASNMFAATKARNKTKLRARILAARQATSLTSAKKAFAASLQRLGNTVSANAAKMRKDMQRLTGVVATQASSDKASRKLIRQQMKTMRDDTNKKITRAIQLGSTRLNRVASKAAKALKKSSTTIRQELQAKTENMADNIFSLLQGNQQKLADNYLSAKAYCVAAQYKMRAYRKKSRSPLSSIGDWCTTIAGYSQLRPAKSPGMAMGLNKIPLLFSGKSIKVQKGAVAKINGLVKEYVRSVKSVRARWGIGIGKYLLNKLEASLGDKGVLQVSSAGRSSVVFLNGGKLGLSNRLSDFQKLGVSMGVFSGTLKKLTTILTKIPASKAKTVVVRSMNPPEWQGN